jgi:uncharacterized membrane-anchored protein YjiN (DUF445 family)
MHQQKINHWIRGNRFELLVKFHSEIGIWFSMMKLNNKNSEQIERKWVAIYNIRLNGAVVGGIVGIVIALLKLL